MSWPVWMSFWTWAVLVTVNVWPSASLPLSV